MENEEILKTEKDYTGERSEERMNRKEAHWKLEEDVIEMINDIAPNKTNEKTDGLTHDLGMDSLGLIILLTMIEETFEIELDESDMNPFELQTVQDVIDLVSKYCHNGSKEENHG